MFANRVQNVSGSEIRAAFKSLSQANLISFAGGMPSPEMFPKEEFAEISARILQDNKSLSYGVTEGYAPLLDLVKQDFKRETIITSGGQQAIDLVAKVLLNEGDGVIIENPSYVGAINCFKSYGAKIFGAWEIEEFESTLKNENIKLIYVIPNFQNPTGETMPLEKRQKLIELAEQYNVYILEDNPYGEIYFNAPPPPNLIEISDSDRIIYTGSFSKTLAPGLRVGFLNASAEIIDKCATCKQTADVHTNCISQMLVHEYMMNHDFKAHLAKCRKFYKSKCELMQSTMNKLFPKHISWTTPQGGLFIWASWQGRKTGREISKLAGDKGVVIVSGSAMMPNGEDISAIRLNFSGSNDEDIKLGIEKLAGVV